MPEQRRFPARLAAAALLCLGAAPVAAQAPVAAPAAAPIRLAMPNHLRDPIQFSASLTGLVFASNIRADDANGNPGTELDPEDDLGLPGAVARGYFGLRVRVARRHEVEMGYLITRRSAQHVLADTIVYQDTSYAAGLRLNSDYASDNLSLLYRFAFHMREKSEIGLAVGLGAVMFRSDIRAVAGTTNGGPDTTIVPYASASSLNVPVGSLGLYGRWQLGQRTYLESGARALYLEIGRVKATVVDLGVSGRYFLNNWLGLEGGYAYTFNHGDVSKRPLSGRGFAGDLKYSLHVFRLGIVATKSRPVQR